MDIRQALLADVAGWLVEKDSRPSIILDAEMRVLLMNEAGRRALAETRVIKLIAGRIDIPNKKHMAQIRRVLDTAGPAMECTVRLRNSSETLTVAAVCVGPSRTRCLQLTMARPLALEQVRTQFRLSQAEAHIACLVFHGRSFRQIALERNASINTVKTQVRNLYQKIGVRSQSMLTRLIAERRMVGEGIRS